MTRTEAGRLGGLSTLEKHGAEHFRHLGGGRPRKDLSLLLEPASEKFEGGKFPNDLRKLRRLVVNKAGLGG